MNDFLSQYSGALQLAVVLSAGGGWFGYWHFANKRAEKRAEEKRRKMIEEEAEEEIAFVKSLLKKQMTCNHKNTKKIKEEGEYGPGGSGGYAPIWSIPDGFNEVEITVCTECGKKLDEKTLNDTNVGEKIYQKMKTLRINIPSYGVVGPSYFEEEVEREVMTGETTNTEKTQEETKKKGGGGNMPRIFRYLIYSALVVLIWKFVNNIEAITTFLVGHIFN